MSSAVDFSQLPKPAVVESLGFEQILAEMVADLQSRDFEFNALLESDPAYKILEVAAYRELAIRNRINHAAQATMLAYASGTDLDNVFPLAVQRQEGETDERLRLRKQLWLESTSTAGPTQGYRFHALSADTRIIDVNVQSADLLVDNDGQLKSSNGIQPGIVVVTILTNGDVDLVAKVQERLNKDDARPITDYVQVQSAQLHDYSINAVLAVAKGPDATLITDMARQSLNHFIEQSFQLGYNINRASIISALHVEGVTNVTLQTPASDIVIDETTAPNCTNIDLRHG